MRGPTWTPDEIARLERYWPTEGSGCAHRFPGRTIDSLNAKAKSLRIRVVPVLRAELLDRCNAARLGRIRKRRRPKAVGYVYRDPTPDEISKMCAAIRGGRNI